MSWLWIYAALTIGFVLGAIVMAIFAARSVNEAQERAWDAQIERDEKAGRLDWLVKEAEAEHAASQTRVLRGGAE